MVTCSSSCLLTQKPTPPVMSDAADSLPAESLCRPLQPGEVVSHLNGRKDDDSPDNLRVYPIRLRPQVANSSEGTAARAVTAEIPNARYGGGVPSSNPCSNLSQLRAASWEEIYDARTWFRPGRAGGHSGEPSVAGNWRSSLRPQATRTSSALLRETLLRISRVQSGRELQFGRWAAAERSPEARQDRDDRDSAAWSQRSNDRASSIRQRMLAPERRHRNANECRKAVGTDLLRRDSSKCRNFLDLPGRASDLRVTLLFRVPAPRSSARKSCPGPDRYRPVDFR